MRIITINNRDLAIGSDGSSLELSFSQGSGTIDVYSITGFAVNQILLIGEIGNEEAEIIKTHASTPPATNTITLASNLAKDHPKDSKVSIILFDQVEFSYAATQAGAKTVLATQSINPEAEENSYTDSTYVSGYYFTRYYNSITATYSDYSDPIPFEGYGSNTVGYAIGLAMKEMKKSFSDVLTYEMLIDEVNACLRYIRGKLKRWSNVQEFNYELDSATVLNDRTWTLPTTYYDKNSNRSMLQIWIDGYDNLTYKDKQEFDDYDRDASAGKPLYFTVYDGSVYITPKVGSDYVGKKVYMDFYTDIVEVDSDADELTLTRFDMVKHWLKWQIRNITENNGKLDMGDGDFMLFQNILTDAVRREASGQRFKMMPKINGISYRAETNQTFDIS